MAKTGCKYMLREYDRAFIVFKDYIKHHNLYDPDYPDFAVDRIIEESNGNMFLVFEEADPSKEKTKKTKYKVREYERMFLVINDYFKNYNLYDSVNPELAVEQIAIKPNGDRCIVFKEADPENDFGRWNMGE